MLKFHSYQTEIRTSISMNNNNDLKNLFKQGHEFGEFSQNLNRQQHTFSNHYTMQQLPLIVEACGLERILFVRTVMI